MFNVLTAVFRSEEMANKAANAFAGETGEEWIIVCKLDDNSKKYFKPCMVKDYTNDVKRDGWFIAT